MLEIVIDDLSIGTLQPGTQVILDISLSSLARSPARDPILALLQTHAHLTRRQLILNITDFDHSTYEGRIAQAIMVAAPYSALRAASFDATRLRGIAQSSLQAQLLVVDFEDWLQVARQPKTAQSLAYQLHQGRQKLLLRNVPSADVATLETPLKPDFIVGG